MPSVSRFFFPFMHRFSLVLIFSFFAAALPAFSQSGSIAFSQPVFTASEADFITVGTSKYLTPTMTVTRTGGSTGALTVSYCVWPSEVADNAVESINYLLADNMRRWVAAGTLTWADGDASPKTLPFNYIAFGETRYNLMPASAVQGTVTYSARLVNVSGGATLGTNATARLEILDAEAPAAGVLNLSSRRYYGADGGSAVITVRRDGGTTGSVSVNYATSSTLPAITSNQQLIGAGVAGTHYTITSGLLTWADGDSAVKTFTIPLPATGSTNGPLNVAINLSFPTNSAVLGTVSSALLTIQNQASTVYDINDNIDGSTYRVSLPSGTAPVRGVLFWFPGTAGDDRHFTTDPNFRKIADQWRFAIASPKGNYASGPNRFEFPYPQLAFFFDRLAQIAKTTGRAEIANAPFVLSGMSAGSYTTSNSLNIWPERTIALLGQQGWNYPPLPLTTTTFDPLAKEIPALSLGGQQEGTQSPPSTIFPAFNEFRKGGVTRSAVMMCWGRGHTFSNTGAAYNSVALYWLDQVMASGRYPSNLVPTSTTAPVLGSLPLSGGWWGARNSTNTKGTSNFYELAGGSSRYLNIGSDASFSGIKDVTNTLVDSWLPTESAARAYRAFVSLPTITFSAPAQFSSGLTGNSVTLSISENGFGSGVTKVEFYDGNTKVGEDITSPYGLTWTPTTPGAHSLTAVASTGSGPSYNAFTLFLASDPAMPVINAGQTNSGVLNLPFSYQIAASGPPTSYALASGSLPTGVTLNTSTGVLSGTPTTTGTFIPAFTATNSVGTSVPTAVTLNISATPGLMVGESFAYPIGTNNPDPDGGVNGNNGLPATNSGGSPTGTSTGLRGTWGTSTDVIAGLSYLQGAKTLTTTGGAARINNATWGTATPSVYQSMTTDPFISQRIGGTTNGNFGVDGTSLYVSFLGATSSSTADAFRLSFRYDGTANFYISNTTTGWSLNGTTAASATLAVNIPTLFVVRMDFGAGATDAISLWVNPSLGQALGAPNATVSGLNFPGLNNFQTRAAVVNAMTLDELRVGTSLAAVTPFTEPTAPVAPSNLAATVVSSLQINLTWIDNALNETGFKLERSPDGSTGWTQIATPAANVVSYADTALSAGLTYYYRIRATNGVGDSSYSAITSATTWTGLQAFRSANGLAADGSQDLLTPAGDGVANLLKYAFNMIGNGTGQGVNLSTPNSSILTPNGNAGLPMVGTDSSGKLTLTYIRRKTSNAPGVSYAVQFTDTLSSGNWEVSSASEDVTSIDATLERVTVTSSDATGASRFARVRVSSNP